MMSKERPLVVGVTGGIGSGKTTIIKAFEAKGVPSYIADVRAKELMNEDEALKEQIKEVFGDEAYKKGSLNTVYLSKVVFNNKELLQTLNALVHPAVRRDFKSWLGKQTSKFIVYESALIFEHGQENNFDYILLVTAPVDQRIERVVKRNNFSKKDVLKRIKHQLPDEEKQKKSDFIIKNTDDSDYNKQITIIYNKLMNKKE